MTENQKNIILFIPSGCLTSKAMQLYAEDALDSCNKNKIRKHLESCNLCKEAFQGFCSNTDKEKYMKSINNINKNLFHEINNDFEIRKESHSIWTNVNKVLFYAAAASVIIMIGFYNYNNIAGKNKFIEHERLLGENIIIPDELNYFTILGETEKELKYRDESNKFQISRTNVNLSKKYIIKNDMIIRESNPPELAEPIKYPFKVFVQKKIDSLLISTSSINDYKLTAEFVINKEGLIENLRILSSSDSKLNSVAVKVLEDSPKWKPATINSTPVDYPVKMLISKWN